MRGIPYDGINEVRIEGSKEVEKDLVIGSRQA
jgi:hypothetical protein